MAGQHASSVTANCVQTTAVACVLDDTCHGIHLLDDACRAHAARNAKRPCVYVLDTDGTALDFQVTSVEA